MPKQTSLAARTPGAVNDVEKLCNFDINTPGRPAFRKCFDELNLTRLSEVVSSLGNDVPLLPRTGSTDLLSHGRHRVLLGLSASPSGRFLKVPDISAALSVIATLSRAHNQTVILEDSLKPIYETTLDGPTILYDFLVVCPMYELAKFLKKNAGSRVYFYVYASKNTPGCPAKSADNIAFLREANNFEVKRSQVNFKSLLGSFIHRDSDWPEWEPNGAHLVFNDTKRIIRGYRERICDQWNHLFKYGSVEALR